MTHKHIGLSLTLLIIGLTSTAVATTTVCSTFAYKQYHYGQKASLQFDVGRLGPESITEEVKEFAARNGLSYSAVGLHDPYENPPLEKLDQILQDTSVAVAITITTSNRTTIATATIETFSFSCGPVTKDWRPYWRAFIASVRVKGYRPASDRHSAEDQRRESPTPCATPSDARLQSVRRRKSRRSPTASTYNNDCQTCLITER